MELEMFKPKHRNRVFYGNACNFCFKMMNALSKCGACLTVSYCSRQHQKKDWSFHKPTCKALIELKKQVEYPKEPNRQKFREYRQALIDALVVYRKLPGPEFLTAHELEICYLPWVCAVCYSCETKYDCGICRSVTYCSLKHQKQDEKVHRYHCGPLRLCRIYSSLGYENGYKLEKFISHHYQPIRAGVKQWPKDIWELFKLLQNETRTPIMVDDTFMNLSLFLDPYMPAAMIIYLLEKIGRIRKRQFDNNLQSSAEKQQVPTTRRNAISGPSKRKTELTIHFAVADDYELSFHWTKIAQLLTDWIINIDKIKIVLTGSKLQHSIIAAHVNQEKVEVIVHKKDYQEVQDLPYPDLIILQELKFVGQCNSTFWSGECQDALFKYKNVPVAFFSGDDFSLLKIFDLYLNFRDIKCIISVEANPFTESKLYRIWKDHMTVYVRNQLFSVYMKC